MKTLSLGDAASTKRLLPLLAVALVLLGVWFGWSAWRQWRESGQSSQLAAGRDRVAADVSALLAKQLAIAQKATQAPAVVGALQAGNFVNASEGLAAAWPGSDHAEVAAADLQALQAGLPATGYGRAGVAQAALASGKPVAVVARDGGQAKLLIALPLADGAAVALAAQPAKPLIDAVAKASIGGGYLALKQADATLAQVGDKALEASGDKTSATIKGSDWTLYAYTTPVEPGPLGFGLAMSAIAAVLLLGGVGALLWLRQRSTQLDVVEEDAVVAPTESDEPTVGDLAAQNQTAAAAEAAAKADAAKADGPALPDPSIFRAYDIRGVVGKTLSIDVARQIGQSIGTLMHENGLYDIVVGRDGRLSGPDMVSGLVDGLRRAGRNVISIGLAPTPLVYFGAYHLRTGCCVAVTGSHNPPDYNGFKIVVGGETLSGETITALYTRMAEGRLHEAEQPGRLEERDISDDYIHRIASDIRLERPLDVVVDAGNGVAGDLGPRVLEAIGANVFPLFCEVDGTFPNHHPDPSEPHNLEDLRHIVQTRKADLGLAFDGDGDRLGVITPQGHNIFPDRLLMLFAADVLERNPGAIIVYDVKCTGALAPYIMGRGGSPLMWKTGHSLIKSKMREEEAELAGEMSGHFFFMERWYGFDDGIYSAARLLEILAARSEDADAVFAEIPESISTPEIKVPVADPHAFVDKLVANGSFDGARVTTLDGIRADWADGWGLVRASNTTPVLVLRFEANTQERLEDIQALFRSRLRAVDPALELTF
ncbi:phosphomannomutase/phosphoglucomutase [Solilutibacter silvestris]|uniref:phosphomannomutase n=1 Tax=Solilutibacter silvestris TaxID=1645665 RepID=A0A2K1Q1H7_9GAMM|nr:phosphomannomutase/phosphoglucomutase [Lysobacter silvestris]PNS08893.1 Phosphoglucomutase/phosphomannomutase, alpha/beta/alpha domain I [Lysobacter silvestris]